MDIKSEFSANIPRFYTLCPHKLLQHFMKFWYMVLEDYADNNMADGRTDGRTNEQADGLTG